MKKKMITSILAGALMITTVLPLAVQAGRGHGGPGGGNSFQTMTGIHQRSRLHLRDGSCVNSTTARTDARSRQGFTYGPRHAGGGPGYGAYSRR